MTECVEIRKKISNYASKQLSHYAIDKSCNKGIALDKVLRALGNDNVRKAIDLYHADVEFDINTTKESN